MLSNRTSLLVSITATVCLTLGSQIAQASSTPAASEMPAQTPVAMPVSAAKTPSAYFSVQVVGQGRPVILIPGLMSSPEVWQPVVEALKTTHQLHLVHLSGFAGKPAVEGVFLPKVHDDLLQYISQQHLEKPVLIGHSLGAFMSYWLASSAPERTGPVIAVDGLPFLAPIFTRTNSTRVRDVKAQAEQMQQFYRQLSPERFVATNAQGLQIQATSTEHQRQVLTMSSQSDPAAVGQAIKELLTTDLRGKLANIQQPILLLGASGALPAAAQPQVETLYQQQLAKAPHAQLRMNTQARHFIMLDDPRWLVTQIQQFLQQSR